ncbi:MAG: hypothetical protein NTAFB01_31120 [Nitrospira sp.]
MENARVETTYFIQSQIVCCCKGDGATDVQRCAGTKDNARWIHQKQIGIAKPCGLNGAENI